MYVDIVDGANKSKLGLYGEAVLLLLLVVVV